MEGKHWLRKLRDSVRGKQAKEPNPEWPAWYQSYFVKAQSGTPAEALLETASIVVIDAETTGLDLKKDQLLSIGALKVDHQAIHLQDQFEAYLPTPPGHENSRAVAIHGIIPNSLRYDYSEEDQLLRNLLEYIGDRIIVGHHIGFDVEMINRALAHQGAGQLMNRVVDTGRIAERLQPVGYWTPKDQFTLDQLARRYRIPLSDRHTALGDAFITAVLWLKLTARLKEKVQRELTIGDLQR